MREAVIVEAVRTPIARGKAIQGWLNGFHAVELLALSLKGVLKKAGVENKHLEQIIGGCVTQAGEQAGNIARNAWLNIGETWEVGATTVDTQCGSAQQANHLISALIKAGSIDCGIACGVESMSRVRMGANVMNGPGFFTPKSWPWDSTPEQFSSAERLAKKYGITREECDRLGLESQKRALAATAAGHFKREIMPVEAPILDEKGEPTGKTQLIDKDQGIRESTLEGLAGLKSIIPNGMHTAGNSSQVSDGSCAILWMSAEKAKALGLKPRARILADVVVGTDPYYMLNGPVDATNAIFKKTGMTLNDIDLVEINEAFAAVVLAWKKEFNADMSKVNVNGGAIAIGHPVGSTGTRLIVTALHELERTGKSTALITMCCGASVGTGTVIERI